MLINPFNFQKLIAPITQEDFFRLYWEKKTLLLTDRGAEGYEGLFSLKDVDFLLSTLQAFDSSQIRLLNNKKEQNINMYLTQNRLKTCLSTRKVMAGFRAGNTIVLNSINNRFEPLRKLCDKLEDVFGHPVNVNMYLTPSTAQGFQAHYDAHDVFILQIEGEKLWKIYHQHVQFPIAREDIPFDDTLSAPIHEVYLKPGDFLYIPRGYVHEALTAKKYSLHLTVGIQVFTWIDFLTELAMEENNLRKALPPRRLHAGGYDQIDDEVKLTLELLCKNQDKIKRSYTKLRGKFLETRNLPFHEGFSVIHDADNVTTTTRLKKKEDIEYSVTVGNEHTLIQFGQEQFTAPTQARLFLDYIFNTAEFSIESLPKELSAFSESSKLALARSLVRAGLLRISMT
ncbi:MAG: hypothetical protein KGZ39_00125 [Simkania sp.]|nr:hypothetical protein [Simkania sp.]